MLSTGLFTLTKYMSIPLSSSTPRSRCYGLSNSCWSQVKWYLIVTLLSIFLINIELDYIFLSWLVMWGTIWTLTLWLVCWYPLLGLWLFLIFVSSWPWLPTALSISIVDAVVMLFTCPRSCAFHLLVLLFSLESMSKADEFIIFSMRTSFLVRIQSQNSFSSEQFQCGCLWGLWL